jgi:hypothetical protein
VSLFSHHPLKKITHNQKKKNIWRTRKHERKGTEQTEQGKEKTKTHHRRMQTSTSGRTFMCHFFSLRPTTNCSHSLSLFLRLPLSLGLLSLSLTHSRVFVLLSLIHALTHWQICYTRSSSSSTLTPKFQFIKF